MKPIPTYKPAYIHAYFNWLNRLRIPKVAYYLLILVITGLLQNGVAWIKGMLPFGEINLYLTFSGLWFIEILLLAHYLVEGGASILEEFKPALSLEESEYQQLKFRFITIPRWPSLILFVLGASSGIMISSSVREVSPEINFAFPELTIGMWMMSTGFGFILTYQLIRQLRQIRNFYQLPEKIDLYDLTPIYAFSKMTSLVGVGIFIIVFITPLILNPESLQTRIVVFQAIFFSLISLAIFYVPLRGANRRLVAEKEYLIKKVNAYIETMVERIHQAIDNGDYENASGMRAHLTSLKEERTVIESIPTWPWRPATFRGFISAILIPNFLWLIQEFLSQFI
jgi:hypothetical protein